jgi:hypothetical protein
MQHTIICDTREVWPDHPFRPYFSPNIELRREKLDTGDMCLAALPEGAVIELKHSASDLLTCLGSQRDRFTRELMRSRHSGSFMVLCSFTLADLLREAREVHPNAIIGTLAAWQRRYAPFCFAGNVETAAKIAESFLLGQVKEIQRDAGRLLAACE